MQTITVELLDGQALPMLKQLEREKLLRLLPQGNAVKQVADRFELLFQQWKQETLFSSSGSEITNHPAYQAIIELGPSVVPFILIKLQEDPQHLFYALFKITGENPVKPKHVGMLSKMKEDWLEWGATKGYLS
ncbi:MAG: hypothetical protein IPN76_20045 [Saprospiraceae bacterium]|nr:hypothetical protein [Saprospiraceae bacterium]